MGCLYKLTSPSNKSYIGITTKTLEARWSNHVQRAFGKRDFGPLYAALRKYGPDNFKRSILAEENDLSRLCKMEQEAVSSFGTKEPNGYNLTDGGDGIVGYQFKEKDLKAISIAQKKRYKNPTQREKLIKQSRIANEAMRLSHAAKRIDGMAPWERRAFMSRARMGSVERSNKISAAVKKAMRRPEVRAKLRNRIVSIEARQKLSLAMTGRKCPAASPERKERIRQKQLASWADPETRKRRIKGMSAFHPKIGFRCQRCGIEFEVPIWKSKRHPKFCSWKCCFPNSNRRRNIPHTLTP